MQKNFLKLALVIIVSSSNTLANDKELDQFLNNLESFSAYFSQTSQTDNNTDNELKSGNFVLERPNKLKWNYEKPDIEWFLIDDKKIYHYQKDLNQLYLSEIDSNSDIPLQWLLSKEKINQSYVVSHLGKDITGNWFKLEPIEPQAFNSLRVRLSKGYIDLIKIDVNLNNSIDIRLSNVEINKQIDNEVFNLKYPTGTEILQN